MSEETKETTGEVSEAADQQAAAPVAAATAQARSRRQEKIGIVTSDRMQKTVVVRVDRQVRHPVYKRYVRRRAKFMAHNDIEGVGIGDQVRIQETRPLSARKRWLVVEVLRKAAR
ncbi:MAG: 30S ribosomal protein S17 [Blastocatellia bacterium]